MSQRAVGGLAEGVVHGCCLLVVGALLVAVGQPIFTDDLWWHLAMGAHYAADGPWLDADPFLFAATGPPDAAAWVTDLGFHAVHRIGGFQALRAVHVLWVSATLALGWSMLHRVSGSRGFASLGTVVFAVMGAYRFFQLRPHLFTILASLLLVRLLVVDRRRPGVARILAAALLMSLWANAHGAFVLGPTLLAAAIAGAAFGAWTWVSAGSDEWGRVRGLLIAWVLGLAASLINPAGPRFLTLFFVAGRDTPELSVVADEWTPVDLFARPLLNVPPTPLVWALVWLLLIVVPLLVVVLFLSKARRRDRSRIVDGIDPALFAVAAASLIGMASAVRLLWLGFFALLAIGQAGRVLLSGSRHIHPLRAGAAVCSIALVPAFFSLGDWRMISQGIDRTTYAQAYSTAKYNAHGVWFMRDSGLEGRVFNDYWIGNFLSYWSTPEIQVFVNGSLNIPKEMMRAARDIRARRVDSSGRTTLELLDLYGVDLFFGTGIPVVPPPGRPTPDITRLLEGAEGWIPIFRNMQTSIHLRDTAANRDNLERVQAYYDDRGVPFDHEDGFVPARVIRAAPGWSIAHGLIPSDMQDLEAAAQRGPPGRQIAAQDRLASLYALIGLYDEAVEIDERLIATSSNPVVASRRQVWSLLHAGRIDEARSAAERLERLALPTDGFSRSMLAALKGLPEMSDDERAELIATLPVFNRPQGRRAASGFVAAEVRPGRN